MTEALWTGDRGTPEAASFGRVRDSDELLHPLAKVPGDTLTETWAYMWYLPKARISAMVHIWVHPNLGVVTAGIGVWQGHKNSAISAELMDVPVCCTEWTLDGEVGWGDTQDVQWGDFQYALRADQDPPPSSRV